MQYMMLLTYRDGEGPQEGTPEYDAEMNVWGEINAELRASGRLVAASGLQTDHATTVRAPDGNVTVSDGPFAETKEILFSFYVVDVEDLDAAIELASRLPAVRYGSVDIRPTVGFEKA
jgi:hypothetical protein